MITASQLAKRAYGQCVWPPRYGLDSWVEENFRLSSEYAAKANGLKLYGWQRAIFAAFTDPTIKEITLCCSTQMVKTLFIQCALAYTIKCDPGPILIVQPNDDDARTFSKERLGPMIRDNECLRGLLSDSTHDGKNTIVNKVFPGGSLSIVGSVAPSNLARRSIRYLFCDEIDLYPLTASKADLKLGDPIGLAKKRMATFGSSSKLIRCCSPTIIGRSPILGAYAESDQRKPWVTCPACGEEQILRMRDEKGYRVRWDSSLGIELQSTTARYHCAHCDVAWTNIQRLHACNKAVWKPDAPQVKGHAGFWISQLYSKHYSVEQIADEFIKAKDDRNKLQPFINTSLAEGWQDESEVPPNHQIIFSHREDYPAGEEAVIPQRGLFLTAAVDVQDNPPRLEVETVAWGRGRENWSIDYQVIQAYAENGQALPVASKELWDKLNEQVLQRAWLHASGKYMAILAMAIDTGSRPKPVYEFARLHPQFSYVAATGGSKIHAIRTVVPVKGNHDPMRILSSVSKEDAARTRQGVRILMVGTHCAKQEIYDSLKSVHPKPDGSPTAGCYHFPLLYNINYFEGLTSETKSISETGRVKWEKHGRNEPLDLKVYNRAAAALVGIDRFAEKDWKQLELAVATMEEVVTEEVDLEDVMDVDEDVERAGVVSSSQASSVAKSGADTETVQPRPAPAPAPAPQQQQQQQQQMQPARPARPPFRPRPIRGSFV